MATAPPRSCRDRFGGGGEGSVQKTHDQARLLGLHNRTAKRRRRASQPIKIPANVLASDPDALLDPVVSEHHLVVFKDQIAKRVPGRRRPRGLTGKHIDSLSYDPWLAISAAANHHGVRA